MKPKKYTYEDAIAEGRAVYLTAASRIMEGENSFACTAISLATQQLRHDMSHGFVWEAMFVRMFNPAGISECGDCTVFWSLDPMSGIRHVKDDNMARECRVAALLLMAEMMKAPEKSISVSRQMLVKAMNDKSYACNEFKQDLK